MTSSSSSTTLKRGLDTMLIVYTTLQGHPAAQAWGKLEIGNWGEIAMSLTVALFRHP
jgi:hypothetical protein